MQPYRRVWCFALMVAFWGTIVYSTPSQGAVSAIPLLGVFFNTGADAGGTATGTITPDGQNITGQVNLTGYPKATLLCGAGNFAGIRATDPFTVTFTSQDLDPGCGFDWTSVFTLTSHLEQSPAHFWGSYTSKNGPKSLITEYPGLFELWEPGSAPPTTNYVGTFTNVTIGRSGVLIMSLAVGKQLVFGSMDFSNRTGEAMLCGAGLFAGQVGPALTWTFASTEMGAGCFAGTKFSVSASRSVDGQTVNGTYRVAGQVGTFTVSRAYQAALPLVQR